MQRDRKYPQHNLGTDAQGHSKCSLLISFRRESTAFCQRFSPIKKIPLLLLLLYARYYTQCSKLRNHKNISTYKLGLVMFRISNTPSVLDCSQLFAVR